MTVTVVREVVLPDGYRWASGGGSQIGECNGVHIAPNDQRGTICGRYGPATIRPGADQRVCGNCVRIVKTR